MDLQNESLMNTINTITRETEWDIMEILYNNYNKASIMCEYATDKDTMISYITETDSSSDEQPKTFLGKIGKGIISILKTIVNFIITAFNFIKNKISEIINHFKKKDTEKEKSKKTPDQIAIDMNLPSNPNAKEKLEMSLNTNKGKIQVDAIIKDVIIEKFNNDKTVFRPYEDRKLIEPKETKFKGKKTGKTYINSLARLNNDETYKLYSDVIKKTSELISKINDESNKNKEEDPNPEFVKGIKDECGDLMEKIKAARFPGKDESKRLVDDLSKKEFTIDDFKRLQSRINDLNSKMTDVIKIIDLINENKKYEKVYLEVNSVLNMINFEAFSMQCGINLFAYSLDNYWVIDNRYHKSITDNETLATFVNEMIKANIPSKYVMINAMCALFGEDSPKHACDVMGQFRGAIIDDNNDKTITKIALNDYGITCNHNEKRISDYVSSKTNEKVFATVFEEYKNGVCISMEKAKNIGGIDRAIIKTLYTKIENMNLFDIKAEIADLHPGNVGQTKDDTIIIVDYGEIGVK